MAKLGLIQVANDFHTTTAQKHDQLYHLAEQCLKEGADLVFFPEAFQYVQDRDILNRPEELRRVSGEWKERCAGLARQYRAYVAPWDYELDAAGKKYNSSYILDREGREVGRYRKVHLTYGEQAWGLTPGDGFPVFDLDFGRVGIMICFDNYWPESARSLALNGAQLILYPLYGDTLTPQWEIKLLARAIDSQVYVAPCQLDARYHIAYTGLVNPEGQTVARLDHPGAHAVCEVTLGRQVITSTMGRPNEYREDIHQYLARCRRPEAYGALTRPLKAVWDWEQIFLGNRPAE